MSIVKQLTHKKTFPVVVIQPNLSPSDREGLYFENEERWQGSYLFQGDFKTGRASYTKHSISVNCIPISSHPYIHQFSVKVHRIVEGDCASCYLFVRQYHDGKKTAYIVPYIILHMELSMLRASDLIDCIKSL